MYVVSFMLAFGIIGLSYASHFRGGTISWEHLGYANNTHQVRFSFRLGWRRDFGGPLCDHVIVKNQSTAYSYGSWVINGAISAEFPRSVEIVCTSYDITENWAYGFNTFLANITTFGEFSVEFSGYAWIGSLVFGGGSSWSVALIDIDFDYRSDTGQVNHPPSTLTSPVIRIQQGCPTTIQINVLDEDNDDVTCRYAITYTECAGVCGTYPHFTLNSTACTIYYDGGGFDATVPVALMLEDHPKQSILLGGNRHVTASDALSSVPLQFLVKISNTTACNALPTYPSSSISNTTIVKVPESGSLNETLYAYASDLNHRIVQFVVIGPLGMLTSDIFSPSSGLYRCYITWQPTLAQSGRHLVCYYAVDSSGKSGTQVCFVVNVAAVSNPCDWDNGGCNDVCVSEGSSTRCECSKTCWTLAEDKKSCIPNMNVVCGGNGLDVTIENCSTTLAPVAGNHLNHFSLPTCQSTMTSAGHQLQLAPSECGMKINSNPIVLEYAADVWIWESFNGYSSIITRGEWRKFPVTCSVPWNNNLTVSFVPIPPLNDEFFPEKVVIAGMGEFAFYFEYYRSNNFLNTYSPTDYPIEVTVNDEMFFTLGAYGRGGLVFFTEECVAMSDISAEGSSLVYPFIEDGCLIDPTVVRYASANEMENRFSMRAFEFQEKLLVSRQNAEIFIQCQVILCDARDNGTRCAQGCLSGSGRGRRSIDQSNDESYVVDKSRVKRNDEDDDDDESLPPFEIAESPLQDVGTRFVLVINPSTDNETKSGESVSASYTTVILICLSVVIIALVTFLAVRLVKNRRKKRKRDAYSTKL